MPDAFFISIFFLGSNCLFVPWLPQIVVGGRWEAVWHEGKLWTWEIALNKSALGFGNSTSRLHHRKPLTFYISLIHDSMRVSEGFVEIHSEVHKKAVTFYIYMKGENDKLEDLMRHNDAVSWHQPAGSDIWSDSTFNASSKSPCTFWKKKKVMARVKIHPLMRLPAHFRTLFPPATSVSILCYYCDASAYSFSRSAIVKWL